MYFKNTLFTSFASFSKIPKSTLIPASSIIFIPLPATKGLGSIQAITHLFIPASTILFAQGGVFPW